MEAQIQDHDSAYEDRLFLPRDCRFFQTPVAQLLQQLDTQEKVQWLSSVDLALLRCERKHRRDAQSTVNSTLLTRWLGISNVSPRT